ncbi:hypothetical protein PC121_g15535 [Phytophthora cactorum]|nr:hypothetical protein PC121_g15535 [Phytophthora cactorum]
MPISGQLRCRRTHRAVAVAVGRICAIGSGLSAFVSHDKFSTSNLQVNGRYTLQKVCNSLMHSSSHWNIPCRNAQRAHGLHLPLQALGADVAARRLPS